MQPCAALPELVSDERRRVLPPPLVCFWRLGSRGAFPGSFKCQTGGWTPLWSFTLWDTYRLGIAIKLSGIIMVSILYGIICAYVEIWRHLWDSQIQNGSWCTVCIWSARNTATYLKNSSPFWQINNRVDNSVLLLPLSSKEIICLVW